MAEDDVILENLLAAGRKKPPADALRFWEAVEDRVRHWRIISEREFKHHVAAKIERECFADVEAELEYGPD